MSIVFFSKKQHIDEGTKTRFHRGSQYVLQNILAAVDTRQPQGIHN